MLFKTQNGKYFQHHLLSVRRSQLCIKPHFSFLCFRSILALRPPTPSPTLTPTRATMCECVACASAPTGRPWPERTHPQPSSTPPSLPQSPLSNQQLMPLRYVPPHFPFHSVPQLLTLFRPWSLFHSNMFVKKFLMIYNAVLWSLKCIKYFHSPLVYFSFNLKEWSATSLKPVTGLISSVYPQLLRCFIAFLFTGLMEASDVCMYVPTFMPLYLMYVVISIH